ncbi:MAG: hypothetical protein K0Q70_785, partial [Rhodospirillales bacterium]|nr:hypothetical protein [Rhodospirillales bacterium]
GSVTCWPRNRIFIVDWPKTPSGVTDWELAFEDPNSGLIALVSTAATPAKLRAVTELLVEQLFLRDTDTASRADYRAQLAQIFDPERPQNPILPIDELIPRVADFLRSIKRARIARAGPPRDSNVVSETHAAPAEPLDDRTTEEIFAEVFRNYVRARFGPKPAWPISQTT